MKLTKAQHEALALLAQGRRCYPANATAEGNSNYVHHGTGKSLVRLGLATSDNVGAFEITPAGRDALKENKS